MKTNGRDIERLKRKNISNADKIIEYCEYVIEQVKISKVHIGLDCMAETLEIGDMTGDSGDLISVDGVMLVIPDLYYSSTRYNLSFKLVNKNSPKYGNGEAGYKSFICKCKSWEKYYPEKFAPAWEDTYRHTCSKCGHEEER